MANPFDADFDAMAAPAFAGVGLADSATFRRKLSATALPCTVLVDDAVQFNGDQTQVVNDKKVITAYFADIGQPEPIHGDIFVIDGDTFTVDSISNKDASRVVCIVSVK